MKKNLLSILALGGLLFASSCQMDEPDSGTLTGEVDFSITAGIPSGITTYAEGAKAFSHQGGASNLSKDDYILRYTLQVYDEDNKLSYEGVQYATDFGGVTFEARLLAKEYDFVFWADFVSASAQESDLYYNTDDLRNISYTSSVTDDNIPSDALDAYYKTEVVDLRQSGQKINNVTLKRPFGKIRFVATDELSEQQKGAVDNGNVSVAYKEGTELPNVFDAQTGKATISKEYQTRMSDFTATPVAEKASVNNTVHENAYLLGYDYIFCSESQPSYAMDVTVSIDGVSPVTRSLSSIPVQENKLTTIIGNFYTNEGSIDVVVNDMFDNEEEVDVEDLIYPEEGVLNNTTNEKYNSIAEAIADARNEDVLTLAALQFNEIININQVETRAAVTGPEVLTIVGQEGSKVNGIYILAGDITLKNIEFNGAGESAGGNSTVYVSNNANVKLENCVVNAPEGTAGRPIETGIYMAGSLVLDGCTIYNNGRTDSYLNPAAADGKIQIINSKFVDGNLAAEYQIDATKEAAYPIIKGNSFADGYSIGVSDVTSQEEAVNLPRAAKEFINSLIDENIFANEEQVKVIITPLPYDPDRETIKLTEKIPLGPVYNETTGYDYATIREAVTAAGENNVIVISEGKYDLGKPGQSDDKGPNGYYLKIDKAGLTLKGDGEVSIFTSDDANTGAWSLQNLVTVVAENVTLDGITFVANYNGYYQGPNKTIEVFEDKGNNFTIQNCKIIEGTTEGNAGCLWIGGDGETVLNAKVINCEFEHAAITVRPNTSATIEGCTFNGIRLTDGWNTSLAVRGKALVSGCVFDNSDTQYESTIVTASGNGFINLVDNTFPSDATYWTSYDNGVILFNGKYPFSGGEGTFEDPYQLSTPEDILMIGKLYQSGNVESIYSAALELTKDIDISDTPIKNLGIMGCLLDGNGHTLTVNLTSEGSLGAGSNVGLFAGFNGKGNEYIYEATTPEELADAYEINGTKYVIKGGCIRDLVIKGTVYSNANGAVSPLGCGQNTGYIINVKNYANITAEGDAYFVAGIISGTRGTGLVLDCENHGTITVKGSSSVIGGITSQLYGGSACDGTYPDILEPYSASVQNCKNYGDITAEGSNDVGGIVGQTHGYGGYRCITDCVNEGNISGATNVGGIIGRHTSTGGSLLLSGNTNSGTINASDGTNGPIYGTNQGTLIDGSQGNE